MADDILDLSQIASDGDRLGSAWINAVRNRLTELDQALALANNQISQLKQQISQAFRVTQLSGLTIQFTGGQVKLTSGLVAVVNGGTLTVPDNQVTYLYVNDSGAVVQDASRAEVGLEIARVTATSGNINSIQNYPLFEIRATLPDFGDFASIDYANTRAWQALAFARKTAMQNLPSKDIYYTLTWQALEGAGWNTAGTFRHTGDPRKYIFSASVRVDTTAPSSDNLAVKISLFKGNDIEYQILGQLESAEGDVTVSAMNADPITLNDNETVTIRAYVTSGVSVRVRENYTKCQVWRLPL